VREATQARARVRTTIPHPYGTSTNGEGREEIAKGRRDLGIMLMVGEGVPFVRGRERPEVRAPIHTAPACVCVCVCVCVCMCVCVCDKRRSYAH
jgi:hypothetical protein